MTTIIAAFMALVGPIVLRVMVVLGIGTLTFTGVVTALQGLIDLAKDNWGGMPADVLALAAVAGAPQCLGIIVGAMVARAGMWVAVSATRFVLAA